MDPRLSLTSACAPRRRHRLLPAQGLTAGERGGQSGHGGPSARPLQSEIAAGALQLLQVGVAEIEGELGFWSLRRRDGVELLQREEGGRRRQDQPPGQGAHAAASRTSLEPARRAVLLQDRHRGTTTCASKGIDAADKPQYVSRRDVAGRARPRPVIAARARLSQVQDHQPGDVRPGALGAAGRALLTSTGRIRRRIKRMEKSTFRSAARR